MLGLMFRLIFSLSVLVWYSVNVWNMISDYFNNQFHKFLSNETEYAEFEVYEQYGHEEL